MKLKYYLRGAGIGLIVATLILMLSSFYNKTYNYGKELTDEEIIEKATELGMVMEDSDDSTDEAVVEDADSSEEISSEAQEIEEFVSGVDTVVEDIKSVVAADTSDDSENDDIELDESTDAEVDDSDSSDTSVTYVAFTVRAGESSNTVAYHLYQAGLIDDSDAFNKYMNRLGVDDRIQAGTFYVGSDSSWDDLVALLVTKQANRNTSAPEATPETPKAGE